LVKCDKLTAAHVLLQLPSRVESILDDLGELVLDVQISWLLRIELVEVLWYLGILPKFVISLVD